MLIFRPYCLLLKIALETLEEGLPARVVLNVNFPKLEEKKLKASKFVVKAKAQWVEKFDKEKHLSEKEYYWLSGEFVNQIR